MLNPDLKLLIDMRRYTHINPCHAEYLIYYTSPHFYLVNLQHSRCKYAFSIRVENSVYSNQMASSEVS